MSYASYDKPDRSLFLDEAAKQLEEALRAYQNVYGVATSSMADKHREIARQYTLLAAIEMGQLTPDMATRMIQDGWPDPVKP